MILRIPFYSIEIHDTLKSTNDRAMEIDATNRHVIFARTQSGGRGRCDREWESFEGNLHASIILTEYDALTSLLLASAVIITVESLIGHPTQYKWPNDILIDGRKVCGILPEKSKTGSLILGLGINVARHPPNCAGIGLFRPIHPVLALIKVLQTFHTESDLYNKYGSSRAHQILSKRLYSLNRMTTFAVGNKKEEGVIKSLNENFQLVVTQHNLIKTLSLGEIIVT